MVMLTIIGLLLALFIPRLALSRARATHSACVSNLRNIGAALQIYANDNEGDYPDNLQTLTIGNPAPLGRIPTCPSDNSDYQTTYQVNHEDKRFTLACNGVHHLQMVHIEQGYPQYYSTGQLDQEGKP
jgi:type II secretory pathway pseudopilin PulG